MLVYDTMNNGANGVHILRVSPASVDHTVQKWRDGEGNPETIEVPFKNGKCTVPNDLGDFLVHHKLARKTRALIHA